MIRRSGLRREQGWKGSIVAHIQAPERLASWPFEGVPCQNQRMGFTLTAVLRERPYLPARGNRQRPEVIDINCALKGEKSSIARTIIVYIPPKLGAYRTSNRSARHRFACSRAIQSHCASHIARCPINGF